MKIFILGSNNGLNKEQEERFVLFCRKLGKELAAYSIDLILCSPFNDSADKAILSGVLSADKINLSFNLHYPKHKETMDEWKKVIEESSKLLQKRKEEKLKQIEHPYEPEISDSLKFSWIYCQMQALESSNLVFVIGGKVDGSASLLLRIAEAQDKNVIPLFAFEGLALHFFRRNYYKLLDTWGEDLELFGKENVQDLLLKNVLKDPVVRKKNLNTNFDPIFFLSYPRARPQEADYVEMQLRRRNFIVIRDDNDINESKDISNAIQESIYK